MSMSRLVELEENSRKWDEYSNFKVTKDFRCKVTSPVVKLPVFQPVVLLETNLRHKPAAMYSTRKRKTSNLGGRREDENRVRGKRVESTGSDKRTSSKPLADRNRSDDRGIFELSDNIDIDVLSVPEKDESDSEYDYETVVDALRKIKQNAELNSSQDSSFTSDSSLLRKILEDPEKLSEKVKQSINYKALEMLKKSIEENEGKEKKANVVQPTRVSTRKRINIAQTRYGSDFDTETKKIRKQPVKKIIKTSKDFDRRFQMHTLKLLKKILSKKYEEDSDLEYDLRQEVESELKRELVKEVKKEPRVEVKRKEKKKDEFDAELDAMTLFKESWISSEDVDPLEIPVMPVMKPKPSSVRHPVVKQEVIMEDIKVVKPKNFKHDSLDEIFDRFKNLPVPKKKKGKGKKKKKPISNRTMNKKSKTFFEDVHHFEDFDEPRRLPVKAVKQEKVEKPKIIPYVPLLEVGGHDFGPMIEIQDSINHPSRPNILGRSYNDPKSRMGERRNSIDSSDPRYHDTLYHLLKNEEVVVPKVPKKIKLGGRGDERMEDGKKQGKRRKPLLLTIDDDDDYCYGEEDVPEYDNYIGENHWTNKGKRHELRNSLSALYPDSDTGEEDRTHESAINLALWDHNYSKRDQPFLNISYKAQYCLSDHNYLLAHKHQAPQSSGSTSLDSSSIEYSAPNSPLPISSDTNLSEPISTKNKRSLLRPSEPGSFGIAKFAPKLEAEEEEDDDSLLDPVDFTDDSEAEVKPPIPKKERNSIHFKKMQKKLMRALEKSKGKGRKEKYELVKKFFAEEVFKKTKVHTAEHNIKERERRKELQLLFFQLAQELPELRNDRPSKIQILQTAEEQINMLNVESNQLLSELDKLRSRHVALKNQAQGLLAIWKAKRANRRTQANF